MGQINVDTKFGKEIMKIAMDPKYTTFCEVGTWNGQGSTQCFYEGIRNRENTHLYSIEGDSYMMDMAKQFWNNNPKITFLMGTLHRNVMTDTEVKTHARFHIVKDHYDLHYTTESQVANTSPIVTPPPCDVILLDGGEFSTEGDWSALYHDNLKVVMLDDTQFIKTTRILDELMNNPEWKCLCNEPTDRNGWAIFERL